MLRMEIKQKQQSPVGKFLNILNPSKETNKKSIKTYQHDSSVLVFLRRMEMINSPFFEWRCHGEMKLQKQPESASLAVM